MKNAPHIVSFLLFICIIFFCNDAAAVKAVANIVKYRQPDGSVVTLRVYGDEFYGYTKTLSGRVVNIGPDGFLNPVNQRITFSTEQARSRGAAHLIGRGMANVAASVKKSHFSRLMEQRSLVGQKRVESLVILVEFEDLKFSVETPKEYFDAMLNGGALYSGTDEVAASLYLNDNFGGKCDYSFDVEGIVSLPGKMEEYGAQTPYYNDVNPGKMVEDACIAAYESGVDFSKYDADGDGTVDNVAIIFAGYNEAESGISSAIWPHYGNISYENVTLGGVKIGGYTCCSEFSGDNTQKQAATIGTFLHEFCHYLGLPDMYDVNGEEEGRSEALYSNLSIMDGGSYLNGGKTPPYFTSVEREILALAPVEDIEPESHYNLPAVHTAPKLYRVKSHNEGEYFLLECRVATGWDSYIGGNGLIVYHIDKSQSEIGGIPASLRWDLNVINSFAEHSCARVLSASESQEGSNSLEHIFYPGSGGVERLSYSTLPYFRDWDYYGLGVSLSNISFENGELSFMAQKDYSFDQTLPTCRDMLIEPYQDGAFVRWGISDPSVGAYSSGQQGRWSITVIEDDSRKKLFEGETLVPYMAVKGLLPQCDYKVIVNYVEGFKMSRRETLPFRTLPVTSIFPYTIVKGHYKVGDVIHINVQNLRDVTHSLEARINGKLIKDEFYQFEQGGEYLLELSLKLPDGSVEVINKSIIVDTK